VLIAPVAVLDRRRCRRRLGGLLRQQRRLLLHVGIEVLHVHGGSCRRRIVVGIVVAPLVAVAAAAAAAPRSWPSLFPSQVLAPFEPGLTVIRQRP